jgi:hypothetical protein
VVLPEDPLDTHFVRLGSWRPSDEWPGKTVSFFSKTGSTRDSEELISEAP